MTKKMGIEGVGPKIIALTVIYIVIAYFINRANPELFKIANNPESLSSLSTILLVLGVIIWAWSVILLLINFPKGKLITSGPYALFLHPLYNSFALFILPAITLYLNSWLYFGASIILFILTQTIGKEEEKYLVETFKQEYTEYRKKVLFKI